MLNIYRSIVSATYTYNRQLVNSVFGTKLMSGD